MMLYRVSYTEHDGVLTNEWFADRGAAQHRKEQLAKKPEAYPRLDVIEVPTTRDALVEWLNSEPNTPKFTEEFYS